jgi:di/tricarboxylate transporter
MSDQAFVFAVIGVALALFLWGRWRFDLVALLTLLVLVVADRFPVVDNPLVPAADAFAGFGHPAVVTVAAVLIIGRSLTNSGVADGINRRLANLGDGRLVQLAALTGLTVVLSAFMNNVGALALMMPVAIETARRTGWSPSYILMPMAFGSLLGGLLTAIGTPPNIVIATFRAETGQDPFRMFDFLPVGLAVAVAGLIFIVAIGWRLLPRRRDASLDPRSFSIQAYVTEVIVPERARMAGRLLGEIKNAMDADFDVVGLIREERRYEAPSTLQEVKAGDVLIVKADPEDLDELIAATGFEIAGSDWSSRRGDEGDEMVTAEAVVSPNSELEGRTPSEIDMLARYGINLLAISRQGEHIQERLGNMRLAVGDVLLIQGRSDAVREGLRSLGGLPLVERDLRLGRSRPNPTFAIGVFALAIVLTATGVLSIQVAFVGAALVMAVSGSVTLREAYENINWPIIVLLGAMIPIGGALVSTGGSETIADALSFTGGDMPQALTLLIVMAVTMVLSGIVNNTAAAVIMAPIAIDMAGGLGASADPFLMAVAIGASAAFLTPIGHQSNTLVMGPGGYRFTDYWRMGLPLSIVVAAVAVPVIMVVWPP